MKKINYCIFIAFFFFLVGTAYSENINLYGLNLSYESIDPLDDDISKITIRDSSKIVENSNINKYILQQNLEKKIVSVTSRQLENFLLKSLELDSLDYQEIVFNYLVDNFDSSEDKLQNYIRLLSEKSLSLPILKKHYTHIKEGNLDKTKSALLIEIAIQDIDWFLTYAEKNNANSSLNFKRYFVLKNKQFLLKRDFFSLNKITKVSEKILGSENKLYINNLDFYNELIEALDLYNKANPKSFLLLKEISKNYLDYSTQIDDLSLDLTSNLLNKFSSDADYSKILQNLNYIDLTRIKPSLFTVINESLNNFDANIHDRFFNFDLINKITQLSKNDPSLRASLLSSLDKKVYYYILNKDWKTSEKILNFILTLREDPNLKNDEIRIKLAQELKNSGLNDLSASLIRDLKSEDSLSQFFTLAKSGFYTSHIIIFVLILASLGFLFVIFFSKNKKIAKPKPDTNTNTNTSVDDEKPLFSRAKQDLNFEYSEYALYLKEFGLSPGVSLAKIKAAYRSEVKKVHPDLNPNLSESDNSKFIKYTKTYEQILDLRKNLGLDD